MAAAAADEAEAAAEDGAGRRRRRRALAIVDGVVIPRRRRRALARAVAPLRSSSVRRATRCRYRTPPPSFRGSRLFEGTRPAAAPTELRPLPWAEAAPPPAAAPSVAALEGVDWAAWASLSWGGASGVVGRAAAGGEAAARRDARSSRGSAGCRTGQQQSPPLVLWGALHHTVAAAVAEAHASVAAAGQRGPLGDAAAAALASDAAAPALRALLQIARLAVRLFDARSLATSIHLPLGDLLSKGVWQPPPGRRGRRSPHGPRSSRRCAALLCADLSEVWLACALVVRDAARRSSPPPRSRSPRSPARSSRARGPMFMSSTAREYDTLGPTGDVVVDDAGASSSTDAHAEEAAADVMKAIGEEHAGRPAGPLQVRISATGRAEPAKGGDGEEANAGLESKLQLAVRTARAATPPSERRGADAEGDWERWCHLPCGATGRAPPLAEGCPSGCNPPTARRRWGCCLPRACWDIPRAVWRLAPRPLYQLDGEFDPRDAATR